MGQTVTVSELLDEQDKHGLELLEQGRVCLWAFIRVAIHMARDLPNSTSMLTCGMAPFNLYLYGPLRPIASRCYERRCLQSWVPADLRLLRARTDLAQGLYQRAREVVAHPNSLLGFMEYGVGTMAQLCRWWESLDSEEARALYQLELLAQ